MNTLGHARIGGIDYIADEVTEVRDGWQHVITVKIDGHKVRATAKRDFYKQQCVFKAEVWSPTNLCWNTIQTLSPESVIGDDPFASWWKRNLAHFDDKEADPRYVTEGVMDKLVAYAMEVLS